MHAERLVHKLDTFTEEHRRAQHKVRGLIWRLYRDLKAYRLAPSKRRKAALTARPLYKLPIDRPHAINAELSGQCRAQVYPRLVGFTP